jgi:hypothetical protein
MLPDLRRLGGRPDGLVQSGRGPIVIPLDNIRPGLDSSQLASALTAETWSDRILGQTRMIDLPNRATWIVTANNPHLSLEIARR